MDPDARARRTRPITPPDIILVLIDDLGWRDLGCYGSTFYETPSLDRLATEGMLLTDAYAAAPVCSPTRASILTGKYPATVGVTDWIGGHSVGRLLDVPYFHHLPLQEVSLARALAAGGYQTWHVGKWHLGTHVTWPEQHGFDVNVAGNVRGRPASYFSPYQMPNLEDGPAGEYLTDRLTDEAIRLIEGAGERPYFLNLWHYAVHTPIQAPGDLIEKYRVKAERLGLNDADAIEEGEPMPGWHLRHERVQRRRFQSDAGYAAMVENLDTNIGRLLAAVDGSGRREHTLVIFTSDNGGLSTADSSPTCNAPLVEGKGWMYDGGVREPFVARWPSVIPAGSRSAEPVTSPDLYPTLMEAAGLDTPAGQQIDGVSILPLLRGEPFQRGPIYWHYPHYGNQGGTPAAAVRDGHLKLIRFFEDDATVLFDLNVDVGETTDLSGQHPAEAQRLSGLLDAWLLRVEARVPRRNLREPFPNNPGRTAPGGVRGPDL